MTQACLFTYTHFFIEKKTFIRNEGSNKASNKQPDDSKLANMRNFQNFILNYI